MLLYFAVYNVPPCIMHTHVVCVLYTGLLCPWYVVIIPTYNVHPYFLLKICKKVHIIYSKIWYLFIFREKGKEGDRKGEKYQLVASHTPHQGLGPQCRHVP